MYLQMSMCFNNEMGLNTTQVQVPTDPIQWAEDIRVACKEDGGDIEVLMLADNMAHGCGRVAIAFIAQSHNTPKNLFLQRATDEIDNEAGVSRGFGLILSPKKLKEMVQMLSTLLEHEDGDGE